VSVGVFVYICAIVIVSVRFGVELASFVKLHGSVLIRGLIMRTCKSECMQCVRLDASLHQVFVADSVSARKSTCIQALVLSRMVLLKLFPCRGLFKRKLVESYNYIPMRRSTRADMLVCVRHVHCTWKRA
jgi:hypothetical protein